MSGNLYEPRSARGARVTVSGSFNRNMPAIVAAVRTLQLAGVEVLSPGEPDPIGDLAPGFVLVASDEARDLRFLESRHLAATKSGDLLLVVNPDGVIGCSTAAEIGAGLACGVRVLRTHPPVGDDEHSTAWLEAATGASGDVRILARQLSAMQAPDFGLPLILRPAARAAEARKLAADVWACGPVPPPGLTQGLATRWAALIELFFSLAEGIWDGGQGRVVDRIDRAAAISARPAAIDRKVCLFVEAVSNTLDRAFALASGLPRPA